MRPSWLFFPKAAYSTIALEDRVTTICRRKKRFAILPLHAKNVPKKFMHFYSFLLRAVFKPFGTTVRGA
jgi:hypothetical protein